MWQHCCSDSRRGNIFLFFDLSLDWDSRRWDSLGFIITGSAAELWGISMPLLSRIVEGATKYLQIELTTKGRKQVAIETKQYKMTAILHAM
jgi:hypothetical protein